MLVDQRLDAAAVGIVIALLRRGGDGADGSAGNADKRIIVGVIGLRHQNLHHRRPAGSS